MRKGLKGIWREFKRAKPGRRFVSLHETLRKRRGTRLLAVLLGVVLMLAGPMLGLVPGPGGLVVFALGLALVATGSRTVARLLDRLECRLRGCVGSDPSK